MTECIQTEFLFEGHFSRRVVARFDGGRMTTEGGALLLREADRKIGLLNPVAASSLAQIGGNAWSPPSRDHGRTEHRGIRRPERTPRGLIVAVA